ncbi:hypothetical protein [Flavobacterium poyangense]|uniref:hypothetical protein n=1 Tax=Flavobacterium poyangense TaxID=2204302 RepID=UPI00141DB0BF|nr:hypothetical protein [Flavobacterium sp. JXAS1]
MKQLKKIFVIIILFFLSGASAQYVETYEPINVFLETQKIVKGRKYILQADKASNKQALSIFNGGEGIEHVINPIDPVDYTDGLFLEKHWKKMYKEYANDTVKRYWKKEDFPGYDFILEDGNGIFKYDFMNRYIETGLQYEAIIISEPMYYMDKKYIMFYYAKVYFDGGGNYSTVIMEKANDKWVVIKVIGDYVYR